MLKSLSVLKIFTFLHFYILSFWLCRKTDNKAKINFKLYDVTDWTIIIIHIFSNVSKRKDNQTTKFCQSVDIFLEKSYTKCGGKIKVELISGPTV